MGEDYTYYTALGVNQDATIDQIRKSYRRVALQNHPDKNPGNTEASKKFEEAKEAYNILSDPEKRNLYDKYCKSFESGHENFTKNYKLGIGTIKSHLGIQKNYYEKLNAEKGASIEEIKAKGEQLLKGYDPKKDKEAIKETKEAMKTLTNPPKKAQYDKLGHDDFQKKKNESSNAFPKFNFNVDGNMQDIKKIMNKIKDEVKDIASEMKGSITKAGKDLKSGMEGGVKKIGKGVREAVHRKEYDLTKYDSNRGDVQGTYRKLIEDERLDNDRGKGGRRM